MFFRGKISCAVHPRHLVEGKTSNLCFVKERHLFAHVCPEIFLNRKVQSYLIECIVAWIRILKSIFCLLVKQEGAKLPALLCLFLVRGLVLASNFCLLMNTSLASAVWTKATINSSIMWVSARFSDNLRKSLLWSHTTMAWSHGCF